MKKLKHYTVMQTMKHETKPEKQTSEKQTSEKQNQKNKHQMVNERFKLFLSNNNILFHKYIYMCT